MNAPGTEPQDLDIALRHATHAAAEAGEILMNGFRTDLRVERKGAIDLVTEYDLQSEAVVVEKLRRAFPEHRVIAEESSAGEDDSGEALTWFVDPLDGTTNFSHGHPCFSVSIALTRGTELLVGVVHAPALGVTWAGARGLGATRNQVPCRVSEVEDVGAALGATGFPYDRRESDEDNLRELAHFVKRTQGIRRCGSAAIDLALVADGSYDFYWEQKLKPWDIAAGALLVLEAGGRLTGYRGEGADVRRGRLVASNGRLHQTVVEGLQRART